MIKRTVFILISVIMLIACGGCQLAVEGGKVGAEVETDALCGVFITFEYLDGGDDYLENADWNGVMNGDQSSLNNREAQKIYAVLKDQETHKEYYFEGIEGQRMFSAFINGDGEREGYYTTCTDDLLMDSMTAYNQTDAGMDVTLEGTLYVCPQVYGRKLTCYCNPVYQTPDGQVYMTPGTGIGGDLEGGSNMSQTLSGTAAKTVNGQEESSSGTVKINILSVDYIDKYVLKQFNAQDNVISTLEIKSDNIPKEITFNNDTAYAILEKHCTGADGKAYAERSVVDMSVQYLDVRFVGEDGFARANQITVIARVY